MRDGAIGELVGRRVPRIGLGLARPSLGDSADPHAIATLVHHALDAGVRYLDTARAYTTRDHDSHSEQVLAAILHEHGPVDDLIVATKGGHYRRGDEWPIDGSPDALRRDCEASLRWLGREQLDLYYLHYPDPVVPLEDSVGALHELRAGGLIRAIGVCNVTVAQLNVALGVTEIDAVQNPYSPYNIASEPVVDRCAELGIPFVAYSPLGGTRRTQALDEVSPTATALARGLGVDVESVLLAWVLGRCGQMFALTGASRPVTLDSSATALDIELTSEDRESITADLDAWVA
jgi:aryl-alcohol dehydrogenase-like predicted oxidoreductase